MEDRRVRRTKQVLKDTLIELIAEKAFDKITVIDIVDKADYNRATFYRHYSSKEEILEDLMKEKEQEFIDAFQAPYKNKNRLKLTSLTVSDLPVFNFMMENANFYSLIKLPKHLPGFQDDIMNTILSLCREAVTHFHGSDSRINNNLIITFRAYGLYGLIREWVLSNFEASPDYLANQYIKILDYRPINISIKGD